MENKYGIVIWIVSFILSFRHRHKWILVMNVYSKTCIHQNCSLGDFSTVKRCVPKSKTSSNSWPFFGGNQDISAVLVTWNIYLWSTSMVCVTFCSFVCILIIFHWRDPRSPSFWWSLDYWILLGIQPLKQHPKRISPLATEYVYVCQKVSSWFMTINKQLHKLIHSALSPSFSN